MQKFPTQCKTGKTLAVIQADPRVSDAFTDSDGTWVYLKDGWGVAGCLGEHIIVEDRVATAARKVRQGLIPCYCQQCKP